MAIHTPGNPGPRMPMTAVLACAAVVFASTLAAAPQEDPPRTRPPVATQATATAPAPDAFADLDRNADGLLSREEAAADAALVLRFDQADRDDDGLLTPEEFAAMDDEPPLP